MSFFNLLHCSLHAAILCFITQRFSVTTQKTAAVSFAAVFCGVTQRTQRDTAKNGCEGDQRLAQLGQIHRTPQKAQDDTNVQVI